MTETPYKIDFFSLRVLQTVFERRSFSAAARVLDLNQSVVSYSIDRMRTAFGDPLFLRQGGGIVPTDRCISICDTAGSLLDQFETLISPPEVDPGQIARTFRISCNFIERVLILPLVTKQVRAVAPQARIKVLQAGTSGVQQVSEGAADLLIGPIRPDGDRFYCRSLLRDTYVCVMDPGNPLATAPVSLDQYLAANRVDVSYGEEWTSDYLARLDPVAKDRADAKVTVPSPAEIGRIIAGTDLIATIPSLYADLLRPGLHVSAFPLPASLDIDLVWSNRTHGSAEQTWLREMVVAAVRPLRSR